MQLIYGIPQNGTFAASLPPLEQGSVLAFDVYVLDNLGYRAIYSSNRTTVIQDTEPPSMSCFMVSEFNRVIVQAFASEYAKIRCDIDDNESGVAGAKFTENSTVAKMQEVARTETMLGGVYESMLLAPIDSKRTRDFVVTSVDFAGNTNNATVSLSYSETDENQYIDINIQVSSV